MDGLLSSKEIITQTQNLQNEGNSQRKMSIEESKVG
jgi:hypothetical protein